MNDDNPFAGKRTEAQILADVLAGQLDPSQLRLAEKVTIEKFDCSGDEKHHFETFELIKHEGEPAEITIIKHH